MKRTGVTAMTGLAALCGAGFAQAVNAQANPGPPSNQHGTPNNVGTGTGDMPGSSMGLPDIKAGALKGAFGLDLSQRIAQAQKLVDQVDHGRTLTDTDTRHIRNLMREDFVAWNNKFDLLPSAYKAERNRWLVDPQTMSPNDWAHQRLKWLQAERDWVVAHGG